MSRKGENIRKRKDGRWEARILIHTQNGSCYKYLYGCSYEDVKSKKISFYLNHYKMDTPNTSVLYKTLLQDWLFFNKSQIKESTYAKYVFAVERHISPILGDYSTDQLTTKIVDDFANTKLSDGSLKENTKLSSKYVNGLLSIIKLSIAYGKENNVCFCDNLVVHQLKEHKPTISVFTKEEQICLQNYLFSNMNHINIGILISLFLGLRIGEVCGLKWKDINFLDQTLFVQRTVMRIQEKNTDTGSRTKVVIDTPKTASSIRKIPIPSFLLNILKEYRQEKEIFILTGTEQCLEPISYYRKYKRILKICNLEEYTYHTLRHTFATRSIENGFDTKSLSEILGHTDVSMTLKRYVHPSMELKKAHIERLSNICINSQNNGQ